LIILGCPNDNHPVLYLRKDSVHAEPKLFSGRTSYSQVRLAFHSYPQLIPWNCTANGFGPPADFRRPSPWPWVAHLASGLCRTTYTQTYADDTRTCAENTSASVRVQSALVSVKRLVQTRFPYGFPRVTRFAKAVRLKSLDRSAKSTRSAATRPLYAEPRRTVRRTTQNFSALFRVGVPRLPSGEFCVVLRKRSRSDLPLFVGIAFQVLFHRPLRPAFHLSLTVLVHYRSGDVFSLSGLGPLASPGAVVPRGTQDPLTTLKIKITQSFAKGIKKQGA